MGCHEVTGTICWDEPEPAPKHAVTLAKQVLNNNTPDTYPYVVPSPTWTTNPGSPYVLPVFTGMAYAGDGSWTGPSVGDNSTRWKFEYVEFTGSYLAKIDITLHFATADDIVFRIPSLGFNSLGTYRIYTPADYLTSIDVTPNSLTSYPGDQQYY